jgi:hypothetical protein
MTTRNTYERKRGIDSSNIDIENDTERFSIEDTAAGRMPGGGAGIELDIAKVVKTDEMDFEQFMRDELEIMLAEPATENEPGFVEINVNGDYRLLPRDGNAVKLRRYHVAVLARAKQARLKQRKIVNPDGSMGFQEETVLSLSYPFQVITDPNPRKGSPWLKQMLSNPV